MLKTSRRQVLAFGGAALVATALPKGAAAQEFRIKVSMNTPPSHPVVLRLNDAAKKIQDESGGAIKVDLFPSSQLGSDSDVLSQLRSGAVEMQLISGGVLANMIPSANIYNTAFAFPTAEKAFEALDGDLGNFIRKAIDATNITALPKVWNNGYRQITTSAKPIERPDDLKGLKFRVAPAPMLISVFTALGTSPTSIAIAETYTALQTKVVDGQENGLTLFEALKLYEAQKHCAMTNHMWDGFLTLANKRFWQRLPENMRQIVQRNFDEATTLQRQDVVRLDASLEDKLKKLGVQFTHPEPEQFKQTLRSAGYYAEWQKKFGEEGWAALEKYTGKLV